MAEAPTVCPNCGVALPEQPLSLCAYCAMPIGLDQAQAPAAGESPNAKRIQRIVEHADYPATLEWKPPTGEAAWRARRQAQRGRMLALLGAAFLGLPLLVRGTEGILTRPAPLLGMALLVAGAYLLLAARRGAREPTQPLLKRPGVIVDRGSTTELQGWGGRTTYSFRIEFEGGIVGEFARPGGGANEEPYVTNLPGVAYTRGQELLAFRHVRV